MISGVTQLGFAQGDSTKGLDFFRRKFCLGSLFLCSAWVEFSLNGLKVEITSDLCA